MHTRFIIHFNKFVKPFYQYLEQLGKTYGYYEGHSPILVTSDLDNIREVYVTQFSNFTGRKVKIHDFKDIINCTG